MNPFDVPADEIDGIPVMAAGAIFEDKIERTISKVNRLARNIVLLFSIQGSFY